MVIHNTHHEHEFSQDQQRNLYARRAYPHKEMLISLWLRTADIIVDAATSKEAHKKMKPYSASFQYKYRIISTNRITYCHIILFKWSLWSGKNWSLISLILALVNACIFHQMRSKQKLWLYISGKYGRRTTE